MSGTRANDLYSIAYTHLHEAGHRIRAVGVERLEELTDEIGRRHMGGEYDEIFYREWLDRFEYGSRQRPAGARSIIVAGTPQPILRLTFRRNGTRHTAVVPPTYSDASDRLVQDLLVSALGPYGYGVERAILPSKLLAVRSGLAEYGRNNIAFIEGMGSFLRLTAFYTDAPLAELEWREPRMTASCENCSSCRARCPTGAIGTDRFLLRAEKCLTFHNERAEPFPVWIDPAWHHCLIGCMHCQAACPLNKPFVDRIEDSVGFSEEETAWLLNEEDAGGLGDSVKEKLKSIGLLDDLDILPRNLMAIIE